MQNSFTKEDTSRNQLSKTSIFVWTVWALMFLIALACVFIYGRNIPLAEDWHLVAPLTGNEPDILKWLFAQNNEHRIPLPKLVLWGLLKITHGDFRSGMILTIVCMALVAALLIKVFYKLRGNRNSYADAFFPILLLHLGNWENFYWSWEFTFVLATILLCILITVIVRYKKLMSINDAIIAGICMIFLPLCGANGLLYLLPVLPCLAVEGLLHFRLKEEGANKKAGFVLLAATVLTILFVINYIVGYERPSWYPPSPSILATLKTSVNFMSLGFGPAASKSWTISGACILILVISSAILLINTIAKSRGSELRRSVVLLVFLGGNIIFALAMGYGRATMVPLLGLPIRYVLLAVPTVIICFSAWQLYGSTNMRRIVQWGLFITMIILLLPNTKKGFFFRDWYVKNADTVLHDINQGVPQSQLISRHQEFLLHWDRNMLIRGMKQLKQSGMGPFKKMKEGSAF
jgi:hypothetical protein